MAYLASLLLVSFSHLTSACLRDLPDGIVDPSDISSAHLTTRETVPYPPVWTPEEKFLHESFSPHNLDTWSSLYTHSNHVAGLNKTLAEETAAQWRKNGIQAELMEYEVLLNYPKEQKVVLNYGNGSRYEAQMWEDVLQEDETTGYKDRLPAFHGYSADGAVEAEYVYVG